MKYSYVVFTCIAYVSLLAQQPNTFVIGCREVGFFSNFLAALNNIVWAEAHHRIPIVYWDIVCPYYDSEYTDTDNAWEYYFEPVSAGHFQKGDRIYRAYMNPAKQYIPYQKHERCFSNNARHHWYYIIKRYIHIKNHIQEKIDFFYTQYMQDKITIGIHLRGTDKKVEAQPVSTKRILKKANKLAKKLGNKCQFFIATDEQELLDMAIDYLEGPVLYYDSYRSKNHSPIHLRKMPGKYKLGEDILIESQLLARCNYFLHTRSNVSIAVCMFNPTIQNIFIKN
ncbi:MAG TPA: hypothetical protein VGW78_03300 [Candidatus Babeliales bacterium]|jgi:hypothetical protein|nr:hypothetical protein [Candidatus Babeliales bacterium]